MVVSVIVQSYLNENRLSFGRINIIFIELLSSQEETELNQLRLTTATKARLNLEDYSIAEERAELSRLQEIGSCLSRHAAKACESIILSVVKKLI